MLRTLHKYVHKNIHSELLLIYSSYWKKINTNIHNFKIIHGGVDAYKRCQISLLISNVTYYWHRQADWCTEKKVNCTLVQTLRLCTSRAAHRGSRDIAVPFLDHSTRRGWGVSVTPRPLLTPRERTGIQCTGGWVDPRAGLDRCGKSRLHWDSIPGQSIP